jgi:hypothetical protein
VTFAPLDAAVTADASIVSLLIFFTFGIILFMLALTLEGRRHRAIK